MCGLYLFNECGNQRESYFSDCGRRASGDARYCEACGSPTLLLNLGLLMSWEEVVEAYGEVAAGLEPGPLKTDEPEALPLYLRRRTAP